MSYIVVTVNFASHVYSGMEESGFVNVSVILNGGTSAYPFNATVTPSEQSPVSAEGNSIMYYHYVLTEECLTNRWC